MTRICPCCSNENPLDHLYCHQCGSSLAANAEADAAVSEPPSTLVRRLPDESRLPPPGSFRSGLYRLIRALMVNQKPVSSLPSRVPVKLRGGIGSGRAVPYPLEPKGNSLEDGLEAGALTRTETTPDGSAVTQQAPPRPRTPEPASGDGTVPFLPAGRQGEFPQGRAALLEAAVYWLARAFLLRHVLPGGKSPSASPGGPLAADRTEEPDDLTGVSQRVPEIEPAFVGQVGEPEGPRESLASPRAAAQLWAAAGLKIRSSVSGWQRLPGLLQQVSGGVRRAGAVADGVRGVLAPVDALAVPRYVEVGAVAALTLVALFLRAWGLPGSPAGIHGDETEMALEAIRSLEGGGLGIWTGVTLGNPAGYSHWMSLIFRLGGADVTTMRLASAIPGVAMVPVGYLLVRSLFSFRVALLAAALLVFSLWFVVQSRIAFGGITAVFMAMLAMWLLVETVRGRRWWIAVAAGVALGLGLYTFKTFLIYFTGIWGAALVAAMLHPDVRRSHEFWLALAISVIVGGPMLLFYATSGFIGPNLNDLYNISLASPSTWLRIPGLVVDAVLLVHLPVQGSTIDGAPAIPVVPLVAALLFWVGLAATLLSCKTNRSKLLLAAWLIGMLPVLFVPGVESRRYLLGIFFVLVFVAVGTDALLNVLANKLQRHTAWPSFPPVEPRRIVSAIIVTLAVAFVALFSFQNLREVERWSDGGSVRWFFNYEYHQALLFLKDAGAEHEIRLYSARHSFDSSIRRFLLPGTAGSDGSLEHGGEGTIPATNEVGRDTVIVLMDEYLPLADTLEAEFPDAEMLRELTEEDRTLYRIYLVRAGPQGTDEKSGGTASLFESSGK